VRNDPGGEQINLLSVDAGERCQTQPKDLVNRPAAGITAMLAPYEGLFFTLSI